MTKDQFDALCAKAAASGTPFHKLIPVEANPDPSDVPDSQRLPIGEFPQVNDASSSSGMRNVGGR